MSIRELREVKDCFDADLVREVVFEKPIDERFVKILKTLGKVDYHADFPRPYFRALLPGLCQLQGVVGSVTCRVTAMRTAGPSVWETLILKLEKGATDDGSKT